MIKLRYLYIFFFSLFLSLSISAETIRHYLLKNPSSVILNKVAENYEIVKRSGLDFEVYVLAEKSKSFESLSKKFTLISADVNADLKVEQFVNQYKDYSGVTHFLGDLVRTQSQFFSEIEYGKSVSGNSLKAYVFNPFQLENHLAKKLLITAATHGDELVTVEVLLAHIKTMVENFSTDQRLQNALKDKVIYFIPVVSPDSFNKRQRYVEGKDPNRAYPWPENENQRQRVGVIDQLMSYFQQEKFYSSLDLHAYGEMVMYPWGYTTKAPDSQAKSVFDQAVFDMSRENNYKHGQISTTIYVAKGNSADFYFWKYKTFALAAEIGKEKIPNYAKIPQYVNETKEMMYRYFEAF